jgi:hypothetical protein
VIPNPKLKLMDQVREVLRVKHYAMQNAEHRPMRPHCDINATSKPPQSQPQASP